VGTESLRVEPVNLEDVWRQVKENLRASLSERRAAVTHDPLPTVMGDAGRLSQVFQNLIGNALKFAKPGEAPAVHVGVARREQDWIFSVRDNGIGFEPEYAERIFIIFQRLHQIGAYPGTGIGLAICKRIVEAHGGRIWAESEMGVGSTFFFTLSAQPNFKRDEARGRDQLPKAQPVSGVRL
jgi:chemotaxis family two-component system sensor kinase Cph1